MDIGFTFNPTTMRFDIGIDGADLKRDETGIYSAVITSLFTELGGYWADKEWGSLLHTLKRAKQIDETLRLAKSYAIDALQWVVDDGLLTSIEVNTYWHTSTVLAISIKAKLPDGTPFNDVFNYSLEAL